MAPIHFKRYFAKLEQDPTDDSWEGQSPDRVITRRRAYYCDTEANLPVSGEGVSDMDWAFCVTEATTWYRDGGVWVQVTGGSGAPTTADYLTGTAQAGLSAEIVVGTTPGGELGGTWDSPTVDATHSGSSHAGSVTFENLDANADVGTGAAQVAQGSHSHAGAGHTILDAGVSETQRANLDFQDGFIVTDNAGANSTDVDLDYGTGATQPAAGNHTHTGNAPDNVDYLVGTASGGLSAEIVVGTSPGGELGGTWGSPTVDATHSGSAHHAQSHSGADHTDPGTPSTVEIGDAASAGTGTNPPAADDHIHAVGNPAAAPPNVVVGTTAGAEGTSVIPARDDHTHGVTAFPFSVGACLDGGTAAPALGARRLWSAPFACTVTDILASISAGTNAVVNAQKNALDLRSADATVTSTDAIVSVAGTLQNQSFAAGDDLSVELVSVSGVPIKVTIQVDFTRP